jgi:cytochrome P450
MQVIDKFADDSTFQNPYAYYEMLRKEAPTFFSETLRAYVITRFEEARAVVQDDDLYSSSPPTDGTGPMAGFASEYFSMYLDAGLPTRIATVTSDGETHLRYRGMLQPFFSPESCRRLEPSIRSIVDRLIDRFAPSGAVDIYRDFCLLVPLYVICEMLGLPETEVSLMQRAGNASTDLAGGTILTDADRRDRHATLIEFFLFFRKHIHECRKKRTDTLLDHLIHAKTRQGDYLTEQELLSLAATLNVGGNETTTNGLGNMMLRLLMKEGMEARLRANRADIDAFIEESLRLESPVSALIRWSTRETEIGGHRIPKGACIHVRIPAVNRDAAKFPDPTELELHRKALRSHMAFGLGIHYCVGSPLARLELKIAMNRILDRLENLKLSIGTDEIPYARKTHVRAVRTLPVTFAQRAHADS